MVNPAISKEGIREITNINDIYISIAIFDYVALHIKFLIVIIHFIFLSR